jgi:3-oxoacyl-[acyl-carrier-protein] synthase-1
MTAVYLNELGIVCALGSGRGAVAEALFANDTPRGLSISNEFSPGRELAVGIVHSPLPDLSAFPVRLRSRNNALLLEALQQIRPAVDAVIARYGRTRVAIVLGTSTSGVGESETAQRHRQQHEAWPTGFDYSQQEMGNAAEFVAHVLGTRGPAHVISTACSSGAKALASGARLIRAGLVDAVVAGGADSLCAFTIAGFSALESVSEVRCNPLSTNRHGINIGEGAALFLMSAEPGPVLLAGWGESSDAHHMSAPDPSGRGAAEVVRQALERAGLCSSDIDYINLHGTATPQNDAMEAKVVAELFGAQTPVSSTKPLTGHTLGAAGAIEAGLSWLTLADNPTARLPAHWWDGQPDLELPQLHLVQPGETAARPPLHVLSQSFAFGGSNAAVLLSAVR